jgi:serine/threonine protein kinase/formylglycine-generating enzyme required for sulfatase activity
MIEPTPTSAETWTPPKSFDEYRILRPLGRGGMGEVYLAHDMVLDRPVAVKFISALDPASDAREQFLIEARAAARLQHPNVLTIYRVGELDDRPFIISEFVRGRGLDTVVRPMPWKRALELGIGLSRGLAAAHRRGVLHRDIKPGNAILGDDGTVKLLDFGLAKLMDVAALQAELGVTEVAPISRDAPTLSMAPPSLEEERAMFGIPSNPPPETTGPVDSIGARTSTQPPSEPGGRLSTRRRVRDASGPVTTSTKRSLDVPTVSGPALGAMTPPPSSRSNPSMIRGTPHYMAPELWRSEPATRRSDVYALGAVLFELCTGAPPHMQVPLYELPRTAVRNDAPPLKKVAPSVDPRFAAIVDKCLRRDPSERYASGDDLREALEQVIHQARRDSLPEGNPYRGLLPFEAEHRPLFFGRSTEIGTILERLRSDAVVVIVGESGVGKSSLCKAGVLPLVADGGISATRQWRIVTLVPGRSPVEAIAGAFAGMLRTTPQRLAEKLRTKPASLARSLYRQLGSRSGVVVFIDQLEELVTLSNPADLAAACEAVASLTTNVPGVRLLMTARSDLLARLVSLPNLGDELPRALYFLRPLSPEKIHEAIVGPARAKGVAFESEDLIRTLVDSTARAEGGLPLLQFALAELWEARANPREPITAQALGAIGGVTGALTRHADTVLASLPHEQHAAARKILTALVTVEGTLARRSEDELLAMSDRAREALDALVRGRLLVAREAGGAAAYEVAHEALIKNWAVLREWLDEQLESRVVRQRLEVAATEWERLGRTREALWSARQLAEASAVDLGELAARDAAFLEASRRSVRRDKLRRNVAIAAVPAVLVMLYGAATVSTQREQARRVGAFVTDANALRAEARAKNAEAEDLRVKAFAAFDSKALEAGERDFERATERSVESDKSQGRASQALEAALTIDAERADVRDMLGDVLYERASAAEREGRFFQLDDLLQRLTLYDASGERRRVWDTPAELTIESSPVGATVAITQYVPDEERKLRLGAARSLGATPVASVTVARGSYLLTLTAADRADVRYPVLLKRGERLRVSVAMPKASAIPRGFVFIPAGRFLFGSTADKLTRRQFLDTVPAHEVTTGAYLIAQRETTYGEWIEYLRALPPGERARRAVKLGSTGLSGSLELTELPDGGWRLTIQPTAQEYSARAGEKITYQGRQRRAAQDWLRMPVGGLSAEDVSAYAAWLSATGRVPGARLCTEHEWERAARGADEREFPSGGDLLEPDDANIDETYGRVASAFGPDEVGSYPATRSPFGLDDMAGNIIEWARSSLVENQMVVRGGAYYFGQLTARSTNRTSLDASLHDVKFGARICASIDE